LQFGGAGCDGHGNCEIDYFYGTVGSAIEGVLSTETIAFGNTTDGGVGISNFVFGCMSNDTASFGTFDGIAGFSRRENSLPSQLSKLTSSNVFSYCLVPFLSATTSTSPLLFGASNSHGLRLEYTPLLIIDDVLFSTFYMVNMTGITVNGTAVSIPTTFLEFNETAQSGGTFFDSGTTYLIFTEDIYIPFVQVMSVSSSHMKTSRYQVSNHVIVLSSAHVHNISDLVLLTWSEFFCMQALTDYITYPVVIDPNSNTSLCYNLTGVQQPDIPSVNLQFSGVKSTGVVDFPLSFRNLFFPGVTTDDTVWCLAMGYEEGAGVNIIGNIAQADHYIETDLANKKIGWASKDCTLPM
jgi:hypothetical protein